MTERSPAPWPAGASDAIGQVGEFLVWSELIRQSGGRLHVFLPLLDRGIDALVHRLDDGEYLALQVKTKTALHGSEAPIAVYEHHLFTDDQLVVGVHLDGDRLGPYALVADAATYRRKAARIDDRGRTVLVADMPVEPIPGHKWSDDLVPIGELASRLGTVKAGLEVAASATVPSDQDRVVGFIGEQEVCRRLAELGDCGVFRPFPDSEIVEVALRRLASGATLGIQVKTVQLGDAAGWGHVRINRSTFVPSRSTVIVALAWLTAESRFHDSCLVVPSSAISTLAGGDSRYFELHFRPGGSSERSWLDGYRVPLGALAVALLNHLG